MKEMDATFAGTTEWRDGTGPQPLTAHDRIASLRSNVDGLRKQIAVLSERLGYVMAPSPMNDSLDAEAKRSRDELSPLSQSLADVTDDVVSAQGMVSRILDRLDLS